jgi:hypothetical protein
MLVSSIVNCNDDNKAVVTTHATHKHNDPSLWATVSHKWDCMRNKTYPLPCSCSNTKSKHVVKCFRKGNNILRKKFKVLQLLLHVRWCISDIR